MFQSLFDSRDLDSHVIHRDSRDIGDLPVAQPFQQQRDDQPVLVTQPTLYGPGTDPVTGVNLSTVKLGDDLNGGLMFKVVDLYNDVTRRVAQKDGVLLIDLARELPRNSAYYYDYLHYTEPGAAEVAGIVDRHLAPFLAARYPSFKK